MPEEANQDRSLQETSRSIAEKWTLPDACIIDQANKSSILKRRFPLRPKIDNLKPENETFKAQVVELSFTTHSGDQKVSAEFTLDINPKDYDIITAGGHMWSQSTSVKPSFLINSLPMASNRVIGSRPYEKSLQDTSYNYFEPRSDAGKKPSAEEGRSYGFVALRHKTTGEDLVLGTIPQFDTFESISFGMRDGKFVVSVQKDFEGITTKRESKFKVFLGSADPKKGKGKYADLLRVYGQELAKIKADVPLMKNSVIGFSYPTYGGNINQEIIEREMEAGKGIMDTYVIDAGWAMPNNGFQVDTQKFPNMQELTAKMKKAGIKPGIWVAPFELKNPDYLSEPLKALKDEAGKPVRNKFNIREHYLGGMLDKMNPGSLDVSVPQVREYLSQKFTDLAEMGFEAFKLDFLSEAFAGRMINNDKTSVEYYRQTIQEIRETVREKTGKEIIIIGCGGPWMESLGLFNGIRMTPDSAYPLKGAIGTGLLRKTKKDKELNAHLYRNAVAVAARRAIPYGKSFGLIADGIHIKPGSLGGERKKRYNKSILALKKLGFSNMFVGDSLANLSEDERNQWQELVKSFI